MTDNKWKWNELRARVTQRALTVFRRFNRPMTPQKRGVTAGIAILLLVAAVFSWWRLGLSAEDISWPALLLSAALVPLSVLLTAWEYGLIAWVNGVQVGFRDSVAVTVVGAVANLLPLPGAAVVRLNDLTARRSKASGAVGATGAAGSLWLGWSLVVAGLALLSADQPWIAALLVFVGFGFVFLSWVIVKTTAGAPGPDWMLRGSSIELASLAVGVIRIWLTFTALGIEVTIIQAGVLVASGAIASTVSIVPGGLGIRELIAGLLAPLVGVAPAAAVLVVALARVIGLLVQAPVALLTTKQPISSEASNE